MKFYPATTAHFDQIISLVTSAEELYRFYPKGRYPLDRAQLEELFRKRSNLTVALEGNKVVGFANLYNICANESAFLGNILVAKLHRGRGIGRQLTEHMCRLCVNEHEATPHLSVFNYNTPALLLYSKLGFTPYAIEPRLNLDQQPVALIHMKKDR